MVTGIPCSALKLRTKSYFLSLPPFSFLAHCLIFIMGFKFLNIKRDILAQTEFLLSFTCDLIHVTNGNTIFDLVLLFKNCFLPNQGLSSHIASYTVLLLVLFPHMDALLMTVHLRLSCMSYHTVTTKAMQNKHSLQQFCPIFQRVKCVLYSWPPRMHSHIRWLVPFTKEAYCLLLCGKR